MTIIKKSEIYPQVKINPMFPEKYMLALKHKSSNEEWFILGKERWIVNSKKTPRVFGYSKFNTREMASRFFRELPAEIHTETLSSIRKYYGFATRNS